MIIYKTTNLINGKIYIGKASGRRAQKIWYLGSGKWLLRAILKYGLKNFKRVVIDICESREDQNCKEIFWIDFYDARNPEIGYNLGPGGEGNSGCWLGKHHTEESKLKISRSRKGIVFSKEHRQHISEATKRSIQQAWKTRRGEKSRGKNMEGH